MRPLINVYSNIFLAAVLRIFFDEGKESGDKRGGKRGTDYDIYEYIAITWNGNVRLP